MNSYATGLKALEGDEVKDINSRDFLAADGGFTEAVYDLDKARRELDRDRIAARTNGLWRYRELLPVLDEANIITLREGNTPLLPSRGVGPELGLARLYCKDLTRNPTGSFKDYSASVSLSKAREVGVETVLLMSAGNASSAFAAYASLAGIEFVALMLPISYPAMVTQNLFYGARGYIVDADSGRAGALAGRLCRKHGWMNGGVPANPYRVEGKKIIGYEIAEQLGWRAPDHIVCPTAGGTSILSLRKAFAEMGALGWVEGMPRLHCIQTVSCAPIVDAWKAGRREIIPAARPDSIAIGLLAPAPSAGNRILSIMAETGGRGETVSDEEIRDAQRALARREGLYTEPSAAAALAGLRKLVADGTVQPDETVVLMITGSGLKSPEVNAGSVPPPRTLSHTAEGLD
jgi:threonine synthase